MDGENPLIHCRKSLHKSGWSNANITSPCETFLHCGESPSKGIPEKAMTFPAWLSEGSGVSRVGAVVTCICRRRLRGRVWGAVGVGPPSWTAGCRRRSSPARRRRGGRRREAAPTGGHAGNYVSAKLARPRRAQPEGEKHACYYKQSYVLMNL